MIALIGAKPVPEATSTIGLSRFLAQEEGAERAFEAQDVALLHLVNTWSVNWPPATWRTCSSSSRRRAARWPWRSCAARRPSAGTRCTGRRGTPASRSPAASAAARITSSASALQLLHAAGQRLHLDVLRRADGARFDHQVGERPRLAEQRLALRLLLVGQRLASGRRRSRRCPRGSCPCSCRRRRSCSRRAGRSPGAARRRGRLRLPRPGTGDRWAAG